VEPVLDHPKVEDLLEERDVVGDRVNDGDLERAVVELADLGEVELVGSAPERGEDCMSHCERSLPPGTPSPNPTTKTPRSIRFHNLLQHPTTPLPPTSSL
jgi:hypothetical protein